MGTVQNINKMVGNSTVLAKMCSNNTKYFKSSCDACGNCNVWQKSSVQYNTRRNLNLRMWNCWPIRYSRPKNPESGNSSIREDVKTDMSESGGRCGRHGLQEVVAGIMITWPCLSHRNDGCPVLWGCNNQTETCMRYIFIRYFMGVDSPILNCKTKLT